MQAIFKKSTNKPLIKNQNETAVFGAVINFLKFVTTVSFDALITLTLLSMTCNILFTIFSYNLFTISLERGGRKSCKIASKGFAAYHTEIAIYPIKHEKALSLNL